MPSLVINFTPPSPVPSNGYIVNYRVVGGGAYTLLTPNPTSSPIVIPDVLADTDYEGTIQSECGEELLGTPVAFTTYVAPTYYTYEVKLDTSSSATVCSGVTTTVYSSDPLFVMGMTLYYDTALTLAVTGYTYVANTVSGVIYNMTAGTGVVGSDTGLTC